MSGDWVEPIQKRGGYQPSGPVNPEPPTRGIVPGTVSGTDGGRVVAPSFFASFAKSFAEGLEAGHRFQVARGWVQHYRPQTAIEVVRWGLEIARDEDPDTPEGFHFEERFGARCDR